MELTELQKCPRCGEGSERLLALSRRDNKTQICDACGTAEAVNDATPYRDLVNMEILDEMIFHKKIDADFNEWKKLKEGYYD